MPFTVAVASDMAAIQLNQYISPETPESILQHLQKRPLLRHLEAKKKEWGSGLNYVREGVMGALLKDQAGFRAGIAGSDQLVFKKSDGAIQTQCTIGWAHSGIQISQDELQSAGIHITDGKSRATTDEKEKLLDLFATRMADFGESVAITRNLALWNDGTQDAKDIPGIFSILQDDPSTTQTVLGISTSNTWWRNLAATGIAGEDPKLVYSKTDGTLTEGLATYHRQLTRYGGDPDVWLAGSDFCDMVEREARYKGLNTVTGWYDKKTNILVKGIMVGPYTIEYDPTLDDKGMEARLVVFDSNHLRLRPQKLEWGKIQDRPEPTDQLIISKSMTDRGALTCNQMDCNGIFDAV
jgi:hypothetical protein